MMDYWHTLDSGLFVLRVVRMPQPGKPRKHWCLVMFIADPALPRVIGGPYPDRDRARQAMLRLRDGIRWTAGPSVTGEDGMFVVTGSFEVPCELHHDWDDLLDRSATISEDRLQAWRKRPSVGCQLRVAPEEEADRA